MEVSGGEFRSGPARVLSAGALRTLSALDRRWSPHLIYVLGQGPARFTELQHSIPGITATSLSGRLQALIGEGLVTRQVCPGPPMSSRYEITARGRTVADGLGRLVEDHLSDQQPP
jgi:DNA-binding HxlR family transcriptional regulator